MKQLIEVCVAITLIALSGIGSFIYGQQQGYSKGYSHGHDIGWEDARKQPPDNQSLINALSSENDSLRGKNNSLIDQYNDLVKKANAALSAPVYQPREPISCTSSTIGSYAYTNCY